MVQQLWRCQRHNISHMCHGNSYMSFWPLRWLRRSSVLVSFVLPRWRPHPPSDASTATGVSMLSSNGCSKCGITKKSGKRSCCARGGSWFNNCGDAGDMQFDHTWAEGIQACKRTSVSIELSLQVIRHRVGFISYPVNTTQPRNVTQQKAKARSGCMSKDGTTSFEDCFRLTNAAVWIYISSIISKL